MRTIYKVAMEIPQETKQYQKNIDGFSTLKVLRMWRNRSYGETVKTFVDKLVLWQRTGYVAGQVWEQIGTILEPSLLPGEISTATKRWDDNYGHSVPIIPFAPSIPSPTATKRWGDDDTAAAHRVAPCLLEEDCKYIVE